MINHGRIRRQYSEEARAHVLCHVISLMMDIELQCDLLRYGDENSLVVHCDRAYLSAVRRLSLGA